jgi:hypothetical protein
MALAIESSILGNERIGARRDVGAVLVTEARHDRATNLPCFCTTETSSERFGHQNGREPATIAWN